MNMKFDGAFIVWKRAILTSKHLFLCSTEERKPYKLS